MKYSLIVPYFKTPEITRFCLYSIFKFARGNPEVIVVDNAPGGEESKMLMEFPDIRLVNNPTQQKGSYGNFEAIEIGLKTATNDLVGLIHSDSIFLSEGWDKRWFGRLVNQDLGAISTFEREANPFRPFRKKVSDYFQHLRHQSRPPADATEKLMYHFFLTRKSIIAEIGFDFMKERHLLAKHFVGRRNGVEVLSLVQMSRFMWHTSNITSVLTGQMNDPETLKNYQEKRRRFMENPYIQKHFQPVLPEDFRNK